MMQQPSIRSVLLRACCWLQHDEEHVAKLKVAPEPEVARPAAKTFRNRRSASCPVVPGYVSEPSPQQLDYVVCPGLQKKLLDGSVWQQGGQTMQQRGRSPLPKEILHSTFMYCFHEPKAKSAPPAFRPKKVEQRVLPPRKAIDADSLYSRLVSHGLADPESIISLVGMKLESSFGHEAMSGKQDDPTEDEYSLCTLLELLCLADGFEDSLTEVKLGSSKLPLAASERFLRKVLIRLGPVALLKSKLQDTLNIASFPREADELESALRMGIQAARAIVNSTALPVLFLGLLQLRHHMDATLQASGSLREVMLEIAAKLSKNRSHARQTGMVAKKRIPQKPTNALHLFVCQLQSTQKSAWLSTLRSDLEGCREVRDLDFSEILSGVSELAAQVSGIEQRICSPERFYDDKPPILRPACLEEFLAYASSRIATLENLGEELRSVTVAMQTSFSESATTPLSAIMLSMESLLDVLPKPDAVVGPFETAAKLES